MNPVAAEQCHGRINAKTFSSFVGEPFGSMFRQVLTQEGIFSCSMVILRRTVSKPDLPGMRLGLENLRSSKNTRPEPCRKHLSYCQAEVASKCFGLTDNLRFCCLFCKSEDCNGVCTYWCWWTEVSSPWARESTKLLSKKFK